METEKYEQGHYSARGRSGPAIIQKPDDELDGRTLEAMKQRLSDKWQIWARCIPHEDAWRQYGDEVGYWEYDDVAEAVAGLQNAMEIHEGEMCGSSDPLAEDRCEILWELRDANTGESIPAAALGWSHQSW